MRWADSDAAPAYYEVLEIVPRADGALRYVLAAWDEQYVFRVVEDYSQEAEEARQKARWDEIRRAGTRHISFALSLLVGLLPGPVQERLELESGVKATRLTLISAAPHFAFGVYCLVMLLADAFGQLQEGVHVPKPPPWALALGLYLLFESSARALVALSQERPMGSIFGAIAHAVWELRTPTAFREARAAAAPPPLELDGPTPDQELFDAYQMREILLAFLPAPDQERLRERFGFSPVKWGWITVALVTAFAGINLYLSLSSLSIEIMAFVDWFWLFCGALLCAEQVVRAARLMHKAPAPSLLGYLVRPFCRKIL